MKNIAIIAAALLIAGCTEKQHIDPRYDEGVSQELATWRKKTIGDLAYDLHFDIPEDRGSAVTGTVEICFTLDDKQEVTRLSLPKCPNFCGYAGRKRYYILE